MIYRNNLFDLPLGSYDNCYKWESYPYPQSYVYIKHYYWYKGHYPDYLKM